jgi:hypothetical protein
MSEHTAAPAHISTGWFKASFSSPSQECVEVRFEGQVVHIRDSKYRRDPANDPAREPIITVTAEEWTALLDELTGAAPGTNRALNAETGTGDGTSLRHVESGVVLRYTQAEWRSYLAGVHAHEFDHPALTASLV